MNRKLLLGTMLGVLGASLVGGVGVANAGVTAKTGAQPTGWTVPGEVLVRFEAGVSGADISAAHRALGAEVVKTFQIVPNLQHVRIPGAANVAEAIAAYDAQPGVLYAQPNFVYRIDAVDRFPNDPMFNVLWGLHNTGQSGGTPDADIDGPEAWDRGTGSRKRVAAGDVDTGIDYTHPDLAANAKPNPLECTGQAGVDDDGNGYVDDCHGIDTINGDSDPMDDHDHGTHTAGTIGAVGNNNLGVAGVNWKITIVACKSHNAGGVGTAASIIECFQYMEIEKAMGVNVVATNNSYGGCTEACGYDQATEDAIRSNMESGILFVASAGNDTADNDMVPKYPVGYFLPNVIGAAATQRNDNIASFSNFGDRTVHVGAPGQSIVSTVIGGGYASFSGTSMASPHIVGTIALLKSQKPRLHWKRIRNLVWAGGDPLPSLNGLTVTGRRINANGAGTCSGNHVEAVLRPADTEENFPVPIAYLNITCAKKAGANLTVTITPGGDTVNLNDDGIAADLVINDGMYTGRWNPNPCVPGTYTFTFSNGPSFTSRVTC